MVNDEIAVDRKKLAKIIGPNFELKDWQDCAAARTLTDTFRVKGSTAIVNARAWIEDAYKTGLEDGVRRTEAAWQRRIRGIFGI